MITLFKGDYATPFVFHAKTNGRVIPLVGVDMIFDFVSRDSNKRVGGGKCEVVDAILGMGKYTFSNGELEVLGEYQGKVMIDMSQGATRSALSFDFKVVELPAPV
jgi:hypothetical protein